MYNLPRSLYKTAMNYCIAHDKLLEAEDMYRQMRCDRTIIRYCEAEAAVDKAKARLERALPDGWTVKDVLEHISVMIRETYAHDNETDDA